MNIAQKIFLLTVCCWLFYSAGLLFLVYGFFAFALASTLGGIHLSHLIQHQEERLLQPNDFNFKVI